MTTVLASAADERYGFYLLSMIGSVQRNSDIFDAIVVHDLGLSPFQRRLAASIRGVELRAVPPFAPHWAQGYTWKPWIWTHLDGAERVFYLDAGATVLRRLDEPLAQIEERGYFVVSQAFPVRDLVPADYLADAGLDDAAAARTSVAAGIIGFATSGRFWDDVIVPTYEDCLCGRSLGFSAAEVASINYGLGRMDAPIIRDAKLFRHDQTVLNLHFLRAYSDDEAVINDLYRFGGWQSRHDHPEQVIWNHRRRGDYAYVGRARYGRWAALRARLLELRLRRRYVRPAIRRRLATALR